VVLIILVHVLDQTGSFTVQIMYIARSIYHISAYRLIEPAGPVTTATFSSQRLDQFRGVCTM